jgi:polyhydroxybutyrate depolymerase
MRRLTGYAYERIALERGAIVVYPQGFEKHWNDCRGGADYLANTRNIDDPAFFAAMIDWFASNLGADRGRVLVTGLSNGGQMAYRLALERPQLVLAIAAVAASLPAPAGNDCDPVGRAVAVAVFNGSEDPVNPYAGGMVTILGNSSRGEVMSSLATAAYWARLAGQDDPPLHADLPDRDPADGTRVELRSWNLAGRPEIAHYAIVGGGHTFPSLVTRAPRILGRTTHDVDAAGETWRFFARQWPRRDRRPLR